MMLRTEVKEERPKSVKVLLFLVWFSGSGVESTELYF